MSVDDLAAVTGLAERMAEFMTALERPAVSGEPVETCPQGHLWREHPHYQSNATTATTSLSDIY